MVVVQIEKTDRWSSLSVQVSNGLMGFEQPGLGGPAVLIEVEHLVIGPAVRGVQSF